MCPPPVSALILRRENAAKRASIVGLLEKSRLAINSAATNMQIHFGFEMECQCPGPTAMYPALCIHDSRASDVGPNTPERFKVWTDEVAGP